MHSRVKTLGELHMVKCVQRTLDLLVSQDKLVEKVYGKQKVYMMKQSLYPEVTMSELKKMEERIRELQDKLRVEEEACHNEDARRSIV